MNLTELAMSYKFVKQTSGGGSGGGSGASNDGLKVAKFSTLEDATKFITTNNIFVFDITYTGEILFSGEGLTEPHSEIMPIGRVSTIRLTECVGANFVYVIDGAFGEGEVISGVYAYFEDTGEEFIDISGGILKNASGTYEVTVDTQYISSVVVYYAYKPET